MAGAGEPCRRSYFYISCIYLGAFNEEVMMVIAGRGHGKLVACLLDGEFVHEPKELARYHDFLSISGSTQSNIHW